MVQENLPGYIYFAVSTHVTSGNVFQRSKSRGKLHNINAQRLTLPISCIEHSYALCGSQRLKCMSELQILEDWLEGAKEATMQVL